MCDLNNIWSLSLHSTPTTWLCSISRNSQNLWNSIYKLNRVQFSVSAFFSFCTLSSTFIHIVPNDQIYHFTDESFFYFLHTYHIFSMCSSISIVTYSYIQLSWKMMQSTWRTRFFQVLISFHLNLYSKLEVLFEFWKGLYFSK